MNLLAGLLALVSLGVDVPPERAEAPVTYQVRFVEMRGLDWRGEVHDRLTPVTRQGGTTVWTATADLVPLVEKKADRRIGAPARVMARAGNATVIRTGEEHAYVADLKRVADGPVGHAQALAYQPQIDHVDDSIAVTLQGRWVDQGLLTVVEVEEHRLTGLATYTIRETVQGTPEIGARAAALNAQVQVPRVIESHAAGEWLIPKDGVLVVSLGADSRPDGKGQSATIERLAIIEPLMETTADAALVPTAGVGSRSELDYHPNVSFLWTNTPIAIGAAQVAVGLPRTVGPQVACFIAPPATARVAELSAPVSPSPLAAAVPGQATPVPPSRVLPTPINHKGEVVALPPLPEDFEPIVAEEESAEPRPAPQSRLRDRPKTEPIPISEPAPEAPAPEAKAPNRELTEAASQPPRALAGQIHVGIGLGPRGLALSGQLRLARGALDSPRAANALEALVKSWTDEAKKRLTTSIGIQGPGSDQTLVQEIVAGLERFARSGEAANGPVRIFELKSQDPNGQTGHVAVTIEADEVGRKLLTKTIPTGSLVQVPVFGRGQNFQINLSPGTVMNQAMVRFHDPNLFNKRDTETHQASTSPTAKQERKDCPQAAGKAPKKAGDTPEPECPEVVEPQAAASEMWGLSLPDAIRIGLENAQMLKVVAVGAGVVPSPTVLSCPTEATPAKARARVEAVVKTIEQAYWGLVRAQRQYWAAETAAEISERIVRRERAKFEVGAGSTSNVTETEEQLERLRLDFDQRSSDLLTAEFQLRQALGLPSQDGRRIAAKTQPEAEQAHYDWESSLAQMEANHPELAEHREAIQEAAYRLASGDLPADLRTAPQALIREGLLCRQVLHQATRHLARLFLEIESSYKLYQTAQRLKEAALQRLETQKTFYEQGTVTIDRYLDAVNRWANAIALEAEFLTKYNAAIADLEAAKGTLLVRDGITLLEAEEPAKVAEATTVTDEGVERTAFVPESAPTRRLLFGLSPVPVCPVFRAEPLLIRVPVGRLGVMEVRPIEDRSRGIYIVW